ncbi:molybdopterin binding oxidoreductase [Fomitiporia mediterranea MF3/22]|uniref:molybdopterin binding oxidoreductase n=1 Tax=Fomitiporia mediterranea (strain MF3/22) TaxID=694068 RepID=UPI0004407B39|nr:molybdopterin binding oxidoreductase [Fomitiporia mediterranea MF3/22]EJD06445.1 molybdopterin binding oxidoreductase [Fomitiporia mediterranea MF3/22]
MGKTDDMDFTREVSHADGLIVRGEKPFNAEPPASALVEFRYTPEELVYCRNHSASGLSFIQVVAGLTDYHILGRLCRLYDIGPVFELDEDDWTVTIDGSDGLLPKPMEFNLKELKENFTYAEAVAALQCAGNRRKEMGAIKPVKGITWDNGVIANCRWGGIRLRDVLLHAGVDESMAMDDDVHVWFASHVSTCQDDSYYGGSIPLRKALDPEGDVLLAYDMNSQSMSPDHGYPLRIVIPGYTGARWVKWLGRINIARGESPNFYQQRDYKVLPPECTNAEQAAPWWDKVASIESLPVNSIIASVNEVYGEEGKIRIKGYAMGNGGVGGQIASVQVAIEPDEEGAEEQWVDSVITYQEGKWSWTLWECLLDVGPMKARIEGKGGKREMKLVCRAKDGKGDMQKRECAWNMRGVAFNAYGQGVWRW